MKIFVSVYTLHFINMNIQSFDIQKSIFIDSTKINDFLQLSKTMNEIKENEEKFFAYEMKKKKPTFEDSQLATLMCKTEIESMKQNNLDKMKEEESILDKLEKEITTISRNPNQNEEIQQILANKTKEKEHLEKIFEQRKLERMKEILIFTKESSLYLKSLYHYQYHYHFIEKLKEFVEQCYEQYKNSEYDEIINELDNLRELFICPKCQNEMLLETKEINNEYQLIECPQCHFYYCTACDESVESHGYDSQYFYCFSSCRLPQKIISKPFSSIWQIKYENIKRFSFWNELHEHYKTEKQLLNDLNIRFFVNKDQISSENGKKVVSLSKLCTKTRIARVLLREIEDRNEVKDQTIKILNTILCAQSIITSAYPALYFVNDDPMITAALTEKINTLKAETEEFINIIEHPEHSSKDQLQEKTQTLQNKIDELLEFSEQELKNI